MAGSREKTPTGRTNATQKLLRRDKGIFYFRHYKPSRDGWLMSSCLAQLMQYSRLVPPPRQKRGTPTHTQVEFGSLRHHLHPWMFPKMFCAMSSGDAISARGSKTGLAALKKAMSVVVTNRFTNRSTGISPTNEDLAHRKRDLISGDCREGTAW